MVALLDINTDFGKRFVQSFPEYFTEEEQPRPYPLSLLRKRGYEAGLLQGSEIGAEFLVGFHAVPSDIPIQRVDRWNRYLPTGFNTKAKQGQTVAWYGKKTIVLQNDEEYGDIDIVPAELIKVDWCPYHES